MTNGMRLHRYQPELQPVWDALVRGSVKPHFMFARSYMDYHADRFPDASYLLEWDGRMVAAFPGTIKDSSYHSHRGLSFGGWLPESAGLTAAQTLAATELLVEELRRLGLRELIYKVIPTMYHERPAEEDLYALFRLGAQVLKVEPCTAIRMAARGKVGSRRLRNQKKAARLGCRYGRSQDWAGFWSLLTARLRERHDLQPVHSLEEISGLVTAHPDNIQLFTASAPDGALVAGVVMYMTPRVAHAQYIAADPVGLEHGALDGLFEHLITCCGPTHAWFSFGISSQEGGRVLNEGLIQQKEEFGGSTITHTSFLVPL